MTSWTTEASSQQLDLILGSVKFHHLSLIETATKTFSLTVEKLSWDAAQKFCSQDEGDLASITDELENSVIHNITSDMNISFWIGLRDDFNSWRWSLNTPSHSVLRWGQNEPDNANSSEHCASISNLSSWRDRDCSVKMPFFCDDGMMCATVAGPETLTQILRKMMLMG